MSVRLRLKIKVEALACQEFLLLRKKKKEKHILKAKSLISGGSPPQCDSGLRKGGENV